MKVECGLCVLLVGAAIRRRKGASLLSFPLIGVGGKGGLYLFVACTFSFLIGTEGMLHEAEKHPRLGVRFSGSVVWSLVDCW